MVPFLSFILPDTRIFSCFLLEEILTMLKLSLLTSAIALALSPAAFAASDDADVERVVVYGTLDNTPLSQTASTISVLSADDIKERNAQHLEALFNKVPNLNFSMGASRGRFVQIRGIGERSQFVDPVNPSVGFLVDGIDYSGLMVGASTFDVAQVEVFKGPNSARFGAQGLAGMINVVTEQATSDFAAKFEAGIANFGSHHLGLAVNGELTDGTNGRLSVHQNVSDGFINNIHLGRDDTNNIDELTARVNLNTELSANLKANVSLHAIDVDNGYDAFSLDLNRNTLSDQPGFDQQDSTAGAIQFDYSGFEGLNTNIKLTHLSADLGYGYDEDWGFVGIAPDPCPWQDPVTEPWACEYSSTDHYLRDHTEDTLEVIVSDEENQWLVGAYYADETQDLTREFFDWDAFAPATFNSSVGRTDASVFAKNTINLSEQSWVTISGRLAHQSLDYSDSGNLQQSVSDTAWGAEISYHKSVFSDAMAYVTLQRSFKMGGVNSEALSKAETFPQLADKYASFAPETLVGLELGVKGESADKSLVYRLTGFYQKRDDVQYKNWINQDPTETIAPTFVGFTNNAASGQNMGIEAELVYSASEGLDYFANLGWLDTELSGITREVDDVAVDISGREQAHAPSYQANVGATFTVNDAMTLTVEADAKDSFYYSYSHDQQSDAITLLHANLTYTIADWSITIYGRNLTDETYGVRGFYFGNDPREPAYYADTLWEQFGEPRRVGLTISTQF